MARHTFKHKVEFKRKLLTIMEITDYIKKFLNSAAVVYDDDVANANMAFMAYDGGVQHLYVHDKDMMHYEVRDGNPPSNVDRPEWLKDLDLHIDPKSMPISIWQECLPGGKFDAIVRNISAYNALEARRVLGLAQEKSNKIIIPGRP